MPSVRGMVKLEKTSKAFHREVRDGKAAKKFKGIGMKKASTVVEAQYFTRCGLRVDSALANCVRHAVNRQHIRGDAVVDVVRFGVADHIFE